VIRLLPRRALLPIAYMLLVIALSSIPQRELNAWGLSRRMWDLGHIPLYAGLAWVTLWAVLGPPLQRALWVGVASFAFALSDEIHQNFVPGRVFSWVDLGADAFGIALGIALGLWTWSGVTEKGKSAA
jgi:VanZ family protein